jgi:hypothetical protein
MDRTPQHDVESLDVLAGSWTTRATHPMLPGVVVEGRSAFEWLEGRKFLIWRSSHEHPQLPDALSVFGAPEDEPLTLHYYDSRGVERVYGSSLREGVWRCWREAPGFSQYFEGRLEEGGATLAGLWHLSRDGETWDADLQISFHREG